MRADDSQESPALALPGDLSPADELLPTDARAGSYDPSRGHGANDTTAIDDVLKVEAAARLLQVGRNTVYELVARDAIPHRRLGKQIRFSRAAVMRWLASWSLQGAKEGQ